MAMEMKKKKMSENATRDDLTEKEDEAQWSDQHKNETWM